MFAFLGDTHASVFEQHEWLFEYPVFIAECTFLDDNERERANRVGHTLWSQLRPHVLGHPQTSFVLIHFSLRHSDREVVEFFTRDEEVTNIVVWASPDSLMPEQLKNRRNEQPSEARQSNFMNTDRPHRTDSSHVIDIV